MEIDLSRVHHYVFTVYALDVPHLDVIGELTASNVLKALGGHVLANAAVAGTYSLNPRLPRARRLSHMR